MLQEGPAGIRKLPERIRKMSEVSLGPGPFEGRQMETGEGLGQSLKQDRASQVKKAQHFRGFSALQLGLCSLDL